MRQAITLIYLSIVVNDDDNDGDFVLLDYYGTAYASGFVCVQFWSNTKQDVNVD